MADENEKRLEIEVEASAQSASATIDKLTQKLSVLSSNLEKTFSKFNSGKKKISAFGKSVGNLSTPKKTVVPKIDDTVSAPVVKQQAPLTETQAETLKGKQLANENKLLAIELKKKNIKLQNLRIQKEAVNLSRAKNTTGNSNIARLKKTGSALKNLAKKLNVFRKATQRASKSSKKFSNSLRMMKQLVLSMLVMRALFAVLQNMTESFQGLAKYSKEFNRSISEIKASSTLVRNQLAAAFEPLINSIMPVLVRLLDSVAFGLEKITHFMAALTGAESYTKATRKVEDYAASLDDAAGSSKKLRKSLMGFDELNVLNNSDDASSGGSGSSGSGSGTEFETVKVENKFTDLVNRLKSAWENADFTEIGQSIGLKINGIFDGIDWEGIQEKASKIGKSVATLINGLFDGVDWNKTGKTVAEGFNTILATITSFVTNFDWGLIGTSISETLNGILENVNWKELAQTASDLVRGLFDLVINALETFDWKKLGETVATLLQNIDWVGLCGDLAKALSEALIGAMDLLSGFIEELDWYQAGTDLVDCIWALFENIDWSKLTASLAELLGALIGGAIQLCIGSVEEIVYDIADLCSAISDYFSEYFSWDDAPSDIISGLLEGIEAALDNLDTWIIENIFDPFIEGFKKAFGIHSPAKEMNGPGEDIILGVFEGITSIMDGIKQWLKTNVFDKFESAWEDFKALKVEFVAEVDEKFEEAKEKWDELKTKTKTMTADYKKKLAEKWETLKTKWDELKTQTKGMTADYKKKVATKWEALKTKWDNLKTGTKSMTANFKKKLGQGYTSAVNTYNNLKDKVATLSLKVSDKVSSVVKSILRGIVNTLNKFIRIINKLPGVSVSEIPVPQFAGGGHPNTGQMFIAREKGPELVGKIGNRNTVMNNDQIVKSVSAGVASALKSVMGSGSIGGSARFEVPLKVGRDTLSKVVIDYINGQIKVNGKSPLKV